MIPPGLHHRVAGIGDRGTGRSPQPCGQPLMRRHGRHRLSQRLPTALRLITAPPVFAPHQLRSPAAHRQITRPRRSLPLRPSRPRPALRAPPCLLISGYQIHHWATRPVSDVHDGQALQTQQPSRTINHARGSCVVTILLRQQEDHRAEKWLAITDSNGSSRLPYTSDSCPSLGTIRKKWNSGSSSCMCGPKTSAKPHGTVRDQTPVRTFCAHME